MIYKQFKELQLSSLGFGTMRLPLLSDGSGNIDQDELEKMVELAFKGGVNYFDTAYPYHGGKSEIAIGKALAKYHRESFYLADKFPGHQNVKGVRKLEPEAVFEEQLRKCGVDYFDFYLIHNVNENSFAYYGNPENRYMDYFIEQKRLGRIKHLGFSCHSAPTGLKAFLELYGKDVEFCQIQLNYIDWKLQDAGEKCRILKEAGLPVWVMEPVRGGKLAKLSDELENEMHALRPDESIPAWAFRWLQTVPNPTMVLSGMSDAAQMQDNIKTFSEEKPLSEKELAVLERVRDSFARLVPCTGCRYCVAGCPKKLDIPSIVNLCNDYRMGYNINIVARYGALGDGKRADVCIGCGHCTRACPQKIDVPAVMQEISGAMSGLQTWEQICKERQDAQDALKK